MFSKHFLKKFYLELNSYSFCFISEKISSVGFQNAMIFEKDTENARETLIECLDPWEIKTAKKNRELEKVVNPENVGHIEPLGQGSAVLFTTEREPEVAEWQASSEDESEEEDVVVVEKPKKDQGKRIFFINNRSTVFSTILLVSRVVKSASSVRLQLLH